MTDDPFAFLGEPLPPTDARNMIPDWFRDVLPGDASEAQAAHDYAYHLIGDFKNPKKLETVRKRLLASTKFLARLAEINPDIFDEVVCAYAERALLFDMENAA